MTKSSIKNNTFNLVAIITLLFFTTACSKSGTSPEPEPPAVSKDVTITNFSPTKALPNAVVAITGTNFNTTTADNTVKFNGVASKVNSATATELVVTVPSTATTGKIALTINGKIVSSSTNFTVTTATVSDYAALGAIDIEQIIFDSNGQMFGENGNNIYKIDANGQLTFRITIPNSSFRGLAADNAGNLYVGPGYIGKISALNTFSILAGQTPGLGGIKDGTGSEARFTNGSNGIANDAGGNIYYFDSSCLRKITPAGVVTTLAGNFNGERGYVDGKGTAAKFGVMTRGAVDPATNDVYVVDSEHFRIRKITQDGVASTVLGDGSMDMNDGDGTGAHILAPQALAFDGKGNLFFSDADFAAHSYKIRMMNKLGQVSTIISGNSATSMVNGALGIATTSRPLGITFDAAGNLYIINSGPHMISKVTFN
jgi:hypothetical protein